MKFNSSESQARYYFNPIIDSFLANYTINPKRCLAVVADDFWTSVTYRATGYKVTDINAIRYIEELVKNKAWDAYKKQIA